MSSGYYGPMGVLYSKARLTVRCLKHRCELEFYADEDATVILDRLQLRCPGLDPDIFRIHQEQEVLIAQASRIVRETYKAEHPEEVALYPGDWVGPTVAYEHFPERFKLRLQVLDGEEETLADECFNSWQVLLEEMK